MAWCWPVPEHKDTAPPKGLATAAAAIGGAQGADVQGGVAQAGVAQAGVVQAGADLALLLRAAAEAGPIAMAHWKNAPQMWEKPDGAGPVSEADLAVNAALAAILRPARPDYGWLSEESPDDAQRLAHERVFILDPIDGTRAYLAGEDAFAIALAVATAGQITAAVVHLPARGLTYAAEAGGIATCNGLPIHASRRDQLAGADISATRDAMSPLHWPGGLPELSRSYRPSLAWRICRVAEGCHDAMVTLRDTWEWDSAAATLIAEAAGCRVTDRHGAPLRFNAARPKAPGVIVAPPPLHAALMAAAGQASPAA